jgi:hypothetical protein
VRTALLFLSVPEQPLLQPCNPTQLPLQSLVTHHSFAGHSVRSSLGCSGSSTDSSGTFAGRAGKSRTGCDVATAVENMQACHTACDQSCIAGHALQPRQQCLASNETLLECSQFLQTSSMRYLDCWILESDSADGRKLYFGAAAAAAADCSTAGSLQFN